MKVIKHGKGYEVSRVICPKCGAWLEYNFKDLRNFSFNSPLDPGYKVQTGIKCVDCDQLIVTEVKE